MTASSTWIPGELNALLDLASRTISTDTLRTTLTQAFPELQLVVEALEASPLERFQGLRQARPPPAQQQGGAARDKPPLFLNSGRLSLHHGTTSIRLYYGYTTTCGG